jgi:hypothetical protein
MSLPKGRDTVPWVLTLGFPPFRGAQALLGPTEWHVCSEFKKDE